VVRYELAQLLDLYAEDVDALELHALRLNSLRLHAMNRAQYPRFYRGRYRLAMSLEMVSNPAHAPFGAKDTKTTLDDTLKILRHAGLTTRELAGTDVGEPDCDGRCTLSVSLRKELLTIAAGELRDIRRQLALWRVVRDTLMHRDERAIWLPHWRARHRQAFRDGVCVAELLVAVRLKFVERELRETEPCQDVRLRYLKPEYLKPGLNITSDIAGDTALIWSLLTDPLADDTGRPAAGAPEPKLSDAPDRVRWLPWQCCTTSWQAAYNAACMYAAFADMAPETVARVVAALERPRFHRSGEGAAFRGFPRDPGAERLSGALRGARATASPRGKGARGDKVRRRGVGLTLMGEGGQGGVDVVEAGVQVRDVALRGALFRGLE
jgi:hypothetical protein